MKPHPSTTREEILKKAECLSEPPIVIEAFWNGDSSGWFIILTAVTKANKDVLLGLLQFGGDMRLFDGTVPPWSEAEAARSIGEELAAKFRVPFYFASPDHPEDQCPRWWERDQGYPCKRCGILLLQTEPCPWRGTCYDCQQKTEREQREAKWTPEERLGPRCALCGTPSKGMIGNKLLCSKCIDEYELFQCPRCGVANLALKTEKKHSCCECCRLKLLMDGLSEDEKERIRRIRSCTNEIEAIRVVRLLLKINIPDADYILDNLK